MHHTTIARVVALVASIGLVAVPGVAVADPPPGPVDESRLQPALNPDFAPWTCKAKQTGPVCTGEWTLSTDWEPIDLPCSVPVYARTDLRRRSTRYYDWDHLNYDRFVHQRDVDQLSTSPTGPATATITATTRFSEPFAVPGDASTFTVITEGVPFDLQPVGGPSLFRTVGTMVEPPGEVGTFTGHVTERGVTTRYDDARLPELLPDEKFVSLVCEAVTGMP